MIPVHVEQHRGEIEALCRSHGVRRLELFGSAARGDYDPARSDLDFLVEFEQGGWEGASDRYFGLLHGLEDLFGRRVDLVEREAVRNRYFLAVANADRQTVYGAKIAEAS